MRRSDTFTFRINNKERILIAELAKQLHRTQSDAIRYLIIQASKEFKSQECVENQYTDSSKSEERYES